MKKLLTFLACGAFACCLFGCVACSSAETPSTSQSSSQDEIDDPVLGIIELDEKSFSLYTYAVDDGYETEKTLSVLGVTFEDKEIDSPYNTYLYEGLPAGPIANPGMAAIRAAMNPAETNYYYYVLNPTSNRHEYSTNYRDHVNLVNKYAEK